MNDYIITTDSGSDIWDELRREINVGIVHLSTIVNEEEYDGTNKIIPLKELYNSMRKGVLTTTSQVNPESAKKFFESYLTQGLDLIHISLSGQLSGCYNSYMIALQELKDKYPNRKIKIIDSISACLGQGLLVMRAAEQKAQGKTFEEVVEFIENERHHIFHIFTVEDLVYLQRGARISKKEVIIGSLIGIKPVLSCDSHGRLISLSKVRGRKNSIISMIEYMEKVIGNSKNEYIAIGHADCIKDAKLLEKLIKEKFNIPKVIIAEIGPIVGAHSGPGTLALFFRANSRLDKKD